MQEKSREEGTDFKSLLANLIRALIDQLSFDVKARVRRRVRAARINMVRNLLKALLITLGVIFLLTGFAVFAEKVIGIEGAGYMIAGLAAILIGISINNIK